MHQAAGPATSSQAGTNQQRSAVATARGEESLSKHMLFQVYTPHRSTTNQIELEWTKTGRKEQQTAPQQLKSADCWVAALLITQVPLLIPEAL